MDPKKLKKLIEKYTGKDLKFSMREFKQLQKLREDVYKITRIRMSSKDQVNLLNYYKKHAQKLERYSERIERRLNIWVKRLEKLISEQEEKMSSEDKKYMESWKTKLDICNSNLIRILANGGELHDLINEKAPDWEKIGAKIKEAFGDKDHPGINTLLVLFDQLEKLEMMPRLDRVDEIIPGIDTTGLKIITNSKDIKESAIDLHKLERNSSYSFPTPYSSHIIEKSFNKFFKERTFKAFSSLKNQIVVDLGAGINRDMFLFLSDYKVKSYVAVEPFHYDTLFRNLINFHIRIKETKCALVGEDMLTFLRRLPNNSVSLLTIGIDSAILNNNNYRNKVEKEMVRVLDPKGAYLSYASNLYVSDKLKKETVTIRDSMTIEVYKK